MTPFFLWLEATAPSVWVRESTSVFAFPAILSAHAIGMGLAVGVNAVLALRLLGNRAMAEDITSEVFLKVHRAAGQLDASRDPAPWLAAIATNACRDLWRSGAHRMGKRSDSIEDTAGLSERLPGRGDEPP